MVRERPDLRPYLGRKLTVIAWLWARTVRSPNPAFTDVEVPLASTWMLSTKKGKQAYVEPVIEGRGYRFRVRAGSPLDPVAAKAGTSAGRRKAFRCLMSGTPIPYNYIRSEGQAGRMGARLMAVVAEGNRARVYLDASEKESAVANGVRSDWRPEVRLEGKTRVNVSNYGIDTFGDLFTPRQLVALTTFSDLVGEAMELVRRDAVAAGLPEDDRPLRDGGTGARAYAEAVGLYLGCGISRAADYWTANATWQAGGAFVAHAFTRQAIPMVWDFAESNPFSAGSGNWAKTCMDWVVRVVERLPAADSSGISILAEAQSQSISAGKLISADPPYYDNIGYADLSDFFYVWLRRCLRPMFPEMFATLSVPKAAELVATPYRHGSSEAAEDFFLSGMTRAASRLASHSHPGFPVTIYYARKQSEERRKTGVASTGWETFLDALIRSGFAITGTWVVVLLRWTVRGQS